MLDIIKYHSKVSNVCYCWGVINFIFTFLQWYGSCNTNYGPPGETTCVKFSDYSGYQYATCLSDSYIKSKSSQRHTCNKWYHRYNYCYYQCQLELNNKESGQIEENCRCTPGEKEIIIKLPEWCKTPTGENCRWYRECLAKVHPCDREEDAKYQYAINYGEKFCQLYENSYRLFSELGQKWIDNVRRCLQLELVPYIRSFAQSASCKSIKEAAFKSHDCCYLAGGGCST